MKLFIILFAIVSVLGIAGSITHHTIKVKVIHKDDTVSDIKYPKRNCVGLP